MLYIIKDSSQKSYNFMRNLKMIIKIITVKYKMFNIFINSYV